MNMIWFIPMGVLLGAALFIVLINRSEPHIGAAWFVSILAALFVWGWTISLYWRTDLRSVDIIHNSVTERAVTADTDAISAVPLISEQNFVLDRISYPYMLAVSSLLVILLLTAPSYMEPQTAPRVWFFYLLIEIIGYLTVSAKDLTIIIYGWVIFDAIDLTTQYIQQYPKMIRRGSLSAVGIRFIGTILAYSGLAMSSASEIGLFISEKAAAWLLLACALRMGILPISQPYSEMSSSRIGLGTMLRLVSVLTTIPVLSRIPMNAISPNLGILLNITGLTASLTGAIGWILSENSFSGNTYAALSICGIAYACAVSGAQSSLIAWGITIVLTCAPLALYQIRNPFMNLLALLVVVCFSGLPYTPNAFGWTGMVRAPFSFKDVVFILIMILMIGGAVIHIFRTEGKRFSELEPWMRSIYPLGFLTAIGTHVFISMISYEEQFSLGVIPASVTASAGGALLAVLVLRLPENLRQKNFLAWVREGISFFWRTMERALNMNWLIRFGMLINRGTTNLTQAVSAVLENNSGLVWELLLLAFLIAVAFSGDML